ncbi:sugar ABC transporter ATP-binding protein [Spiractinospora alimapuensis]|nr:sugar ABC transporter ATP-binding protein [Spiractinospora alimapuensis]
MTKSFGSVRALCGLSLELAPGEIHALVGENGAGKSTLVKTIAGVHEPDTGTVVVDGRPTRFGGPADAQRAGVAVIYQEPTLFPDLSVAENIFMGRQPLRAARLIDKRRMRREAAELFTRLGVSLDPNRPARGLSIADQQLVEIAKALSLNARVLVMDEPTAALSGVEVRRLFSVARALRDNGAAVLFISHRFDEVFALSDRITVVRDGAHISTHLTPEVDVDTLIRHMVGRDVTTLFPRRDSLDAEAEVLLDVAGLTRHGSFADVTFRVRSGEIVALAGLVGAGRSEVVRAVFGVDGYDSGTVHVRGEALPRGRPSTAMRSGMALVPEDRRQQGLVMDLSVQRNATMTRRRALSRLGVLWSSVERDAAREWAVRLQVKAARLTDAVSTLSGGNQQKVVLAKWLATEPWVLLIDEPTRGIDVGTKAEVHRLLSELAADGLAVVMVSSELPEVLGMADRVLVMHEGRVTAELDRDEATESAIMYAATGSEEAPA